MIAQTTSARSPGWHLPHDLPICKGPVLAAISAGEFRPRLICSRHPPRFISPRASSSSTFLESRVRCDLPPIHQRPALSPFSDIRPKKGRLDASGDGGGRVEPSPRIRVGGGSGDARDGQVTDERNTLGTRSTSELLIPQAEQWLWDLRVDARSSRLRLHCVGCL